MATEYKTDTTQRSCSRTTPSSSAKSVFTLPKSCNLNRGVHTALGARLRMHAHDVPAWAGGSAHQKPADNPFRAATQDGANPFAAAAQQPVPLWVPARPEGTHNPFATSSVGEAPPSKQAAPAARPSPPPSRPWVGCCGITPWAGCIGCVCIGVTCSFAGAVAYDVEYWEAFGVIYSLDAIASIGAMVPPHCRTTAPPHRRTAAPLHPCTPCTSCVPPDLPLRPAQVLQRHPYQRVAAGSPRPHLLVVHPADHRPLLHPCEALCYHTLHRGAEVLLGPQPGRLVWLPGHRRDRLEHRQSIRCPRKDGARPEYGRD